MSGQAIRRPAYRRRVVERHPVAGPGAPIVAGHHEALEAELLHDLDLVLGHPAKGIVAVIRQPARLATVAVAAQVGDDDGEVLGQPRGDESPVDVRQRVAVQEEERRAGASDDAVIGDAGIAGRQVEAAEASYIARSFRTAIIDGPRWRGAPSPAGWGPCRAPLWTSARRGRGSTSRGAGSRPAR